jgi:uncharacterized protein (TIGR03067 family)
MPTSVQLPVTAAKSRRPDVKDPYIAELLDVIVETKSVDAFLVTVRLLIDAKPEARQVLPMVIRNAERLGIYGRHVLDEKTPSAKLVQEMNGLIRELSTGKGSNADVTSRMEKLLSESENLRQIKEEWLRFWQIDQPSHMTYERVHGGIGPDSSSSSSSPPPKTAQPATGEKPSQPAAPAPANPYDDILKTVREAPSGGRPLAPAPATVAKPRPALQDKVYTVTGAVQSPGVFPLQDRQTVLDALLQAGGLTEEAIPDKITLRRASQPNQPQVVLRVYWTKIVQLGDATTNYQIAPGDRIHVPSRKAKAQSQAAKEDKTVGLLSGSWRFVNGEANGRDYSGKLTPRSIMKVAGNKVIIDAGLEDSKPVELEFTINTTRKPHEIDLLFRTVMETERVMGIFEVQGDTMKLCYSAPPGASRPTAFSSTSDKAALKIQLFTLKRIDQPAAGK